MDLWRRISALRGRLTRSDVQFHLSWSRAHQTVDQMRAGTISFRDWVGNNWADNIAKKGASRDALDPRRVSNYFKELAVAVAWLRWCIWVHQCCCEDRSWADENFVREPYVPRGPELFITAHDLETCQGERWHVLLCRLSHADCWGRVHEEEYV